MSSYSKRTEFKELVGKTIVNISAFKGDDTVMIETLDENHYRMYHYQDCCECVSVEEIIGDLSDLIDSPILLAEEVTQNDDNASESGTWTFYKLSTIKGSVTIRWYGSSNGYYSESVQFELA